MHSRSHFIPFRAFLPNITGVGTAFLAGSLCAQVLSVPDNNDLPVSNSDFTDLYLQVAEPRGLGGVVGYGRGASLLILITMEMTIYSWLIPMDVCSDLLSVYP